MPVAHNVSLHAFGWSLIDLERPEAEDRRPLFERLREQKEKKQMEWDEQLKLSELLWSLSAVLTLSTAISSSHGHSAHSNVR